jgi:hypothetical protein
MKTWAIGENNPQEASLAKLNKILKTDYPKEQVALFLQCQT